jgi:hypothetical protein
LGPSRVQVEKGCAGGLGQAPGTPGLGDAAEPNKARLSASVRPFTKPHNGFAA